MGERFIPDSDAKFRAKAEAFARSIAKDPGRYTIAQHDAELMSRAAQEFAAALFKALPNNRNTATVLGKVEARKRCEQIMRRLGRIIRASDQISDADKACVFIHARDPRPIRRTVPMSPPVLHFVGAENEGGYNAAGLHVIRFREADGIFRRKPHGAVRIELFVDLVPDGQPVPRFPGEQLGGRPWYLRSFTTSPIRVNPPVPPVPMLVVYWARWADAKGNVGPFSATCRTRVEGWGGIAATPLIGPLADAKLLERDAKYLTTITQLRQIEQVTVERLLPDSRERREREEPDAATAAPKQLPMSDAA